MTKDEFAQRVLAAEPTLYNVAKTILKREADCEDAVGDAILAAWSRLGSLREESFFKTWLVRILINECNKRLRSQKTTVPYEDYMDAPAPEREDYSDLYRAVSGLSPKIRTAVELFYIEGYSIKETARLLRVPQGTVKSRLNAGRKILKEMLSDEELS